MNRSPITSNVCTWVMSLVVRVISEAVPIWSNSVREKFSTWVKTKLRISRPKRIPTIDDRKLATIEKLVLARATISM